MAQRNDWISLWWPGSPQDRAEFWSKPVLTEWLIALSMKLFGLEWAHAPANQMVADWRVEWAVRLPGIALSIAAIWSVWQLVSRLAGRRAGALAALVLATSSQWALITRQAMTDMPFVSPMTIALAFAALALIGPEEEFEAPLERRALRFGLSVPRATAWWVFFALFSICTLPQLIVFSIAAADDRQHPRLPRPHHRPRADAALLRRLLHRRCGGARAPRTAASSTCSRPTCSARWPRWPRGRPASRCPASCSWCGCRRRALARHLPQARDPARRRCIFVATALPLVPRHAHPPRRGFWMEFIGDNYVHRAQGRHGDRGTFEYYIQYLGYGMFPWSGIATLAAALGLHEAARQVAARAAGRLRARLVPRRVLDGVAGQHQVPPLHPAGAAGAGRARRPVPRRLLDARRRKGAAVGDGARGACR